MGSKITHLYPLCGKCHRTIEFSKEGKRSLPNVRKKFNKRRRRAVQLQRERANKNKTLRQSYETIGIDEASKRWGL